MILQRAYYRTSRRSWLILLGAAAFWALLLFTVRQSEREVTQLLLIYGEVVLPPVMVGICINMTLNDPSREIVLIVPYPFWCVTLSRVIMLVVFAVLTWGLVLTIGYILQQDITVAPLQMFIGGFVTSILFTCTGLWSAFQLRNLVGSSVLVAGLWTAPLLFREALLAHPLGQLIHPFLTLQAADSPLWVANRLTLTAIAVVLLVLALRLATQEELLLQDTRED